jgi:hypothetical protein
MADLYKYNHKNTRATGTYKGTRAEADEMTKQV